MNSPLIKDHDRGECHIGSEDDAPPEPLAGLASQSDDIGVIEQDDRGDDAGQDMPMTGMADALLPRGPDANDLVQLDRHKDVDKGGDEIHLHHLPQRAELDWIMEYGPQSLPKTCFRDAPLREALANEFAPAYHTPTGESLTFVD